MNFDIRLSPAGSSQDITDRNEGLPAAEAKEKGNLLGRIFWIIVDTIGEIIARIIRLFFGVHSDASHSAAAADPNRLSLRGRVRVPADHQTVLQNIEAVARENVRYPLKISLGNVPIEIANQGDMKILDIIKEQIETEKTYLKGLEGMQASGMELLKSRDSQVRQFGQLLVDSSAPIIAASKRFLQSSFPFPTAQEIEEYSQSLVDYLELHYGSIQSSLTKLSLNPARIDQINAAFASFGAESGGGNRINCSSSTILPVQRMPRLVLFANDLANSSSISLKKKNPEIVGNVAHWENAAKKLNEAQRAVDCKAYVQELHSANTDFTPYSTKSMFTFANHPELSKEKKAELFLAMVRNSKLQKLVGPKGSDENIKAGYQVLRRNVMKFFFNGEAEKLPYFALHYSVKVRNESGKKRLVPLYKSLFLQKVIKGHQKDAFEKLAKGKSLSQKETKSLQKAMEPFRILCSATSFTFDLNGEFIVKTKNPDDQECIDQLVRAMHLNGENYKKVISNAREAAGIPSLEDEGIESL